MTFKSITIPAQYKEGFHKLIVENLSKTNIVHREIHLFERGKKPIDDFEVFEAIDRAEAPQVLQPPPKLKKAPATFEEGVKTIISMGHYFHAAQLAVKQENAKTAGDDVKVRNSINELQKYLEDASKKLR
jgi:hypothetical protein